MKGQILHLDEDTGEGVITATDGRRYGFSAPDLRGSGQVARAGVGVDFEVTGDRAREIYPDPAAPRPALARIGEKNRMVAGWMIAIIPAIRWKPAYCSAVTVCPQDSIEATC